MQGFAADFKDRDWSCTPKFNVVAHFDLKITILVAQNEGDKMKVIVLLNQS